jgi:ABC-type glycerol-3-phosphate transport system substrate-binding protein
MKKGNLIIGMVLICLISTMSLFAGGKTEKAGAGSAIDLAPQELIEYNLIAGKPFAGETIRVLCVSEDIPQFKAIKSKVPEFEELTGIKVIWDYTVWDAWQEKFIAEATTGGGNYDILTYILKSLILL